MAADNPPLRLPATPSGKIDAPTNRGGPMRPVASWMLSAVVMALLVACTERAPQDKE